MSFEIGTATYSLAAFSLFILLLAQFKNWSTGTSSFIFLGATSVTLVWALCLALQIRIPVGLFYIVPLIEILKNLSWFALLLSVLGIRNLLFPDNQEQQLQQDIQGLGLVTSLALGIPLALFGYLLFLKYISEVIIFFPDFGGKIVHLGFLITAITGLALLEQVIRNTRHHYRWHLKYICLGLGVFFSFDVFLYSEALLFDRVNTVFWQVRGGVVALAIPFLALGVLRTRQQPIQLNISRRLVFHTGVLLGAGVYLLLMAAAGYYIRDFSGQWGVLLQALFWIISLSLLVVLIFSGRIRSLIKVYIGRNLFSSKYDYRDEWMRISHILSETDIDESLPVRAIRALADSVDSTGGMLWLTSDGDHYEQVAHMEMGWIDNCELTSRDYLIRYLHAKNELVSLGHLGEELDVSELPSWLGEIKNAWLIVPLELQRKLIGFVVLKRPRVEFELNWEDHDLLKAAGQQAASYLAQMTALDALSEARQFAAFNQGSAFVVHDIKTLNSQLSMLVSNAAKHKRNPSFIEDMIKTTEHAVKKMDFLLKHFKSGSMPEDDKVSLLNLVDTVKQIVISQSRMKPVPLVSCSEPCITISANEVELTSAISHLIQNAQEATPDDGKVEIQLAINGGFAELIISDTGSGMTQEFVRTRLFKPFDSSKGVTGMGIGVFQSREYIRKLGGNLVVKSTLGEGSAFLITLPLENLSNVQEDTSTN